MVKVLKRTISEKAYAVGTEMNLLSNFLCDGSFEHPKQLFKMIGKKIFTLKIFAYLDLCIIIEPRHVISNNVAFRHVSTQTSLCSLLLSLETSNYV